MTRHRSHSAAFKRQVAEEFVVGETLHALSKRHDISRQLIRIWVGKFEAGAWDEDVQAAEIVQKYEAEIAVLERMVGRQTLEIELLKGALKHAPRQRSAVISVQRGCELMIWRDPPATTPRTFSWTGTNSSPGSARSATNSRATATVASGRRCVTRAWW